MTYTTRFLLCFLVLAVGSLATRKIENVAGRTLLQALDLSTESLSGDLGAAIAELESNTGASAASTFGTAEGSAGAAAAVSAGPSVVVADPPPDNLIISLAQGVANNFATLVANSIADFLLQVGGGCNNFFADSGVFADVTAGALVDEVEGASASIVFADDNAAIEAIAAATQPAFQALIDSVCAGEDVDAAKATLASAIADPYFQVVLEALRAVAANSGCEIVVEFANGALATSCPAGTSGTDVCSFLFRFCCGSQAATCRCGGGCRATLVDLGNGVGYEVTDSRRSSPQVGDVCMCA